MRGMCLLDKATRPPTPLPPLAPHISLSRRFFLEGTCPYVFYERLRSPQACRTCMSWVGGLATSERKCRQNGETTGKLRHGGTFYWVLDRHRRADRDTGRNPTRWTRRPLCTIIASTSAETEAPTRMLGFLRAEFVRSRVAAVSGRWYELEWGWTNWFCGFTRYSDAKCTPTVCTPGLMCFGLCQGATEMISVRMRPGVVVR